MLQTIKSDIPFQDGCSNEQTDDNNYQLKNNSYRTIRPIGQGRFGVVYLAKQNKDFHEQPTRTVALKQAEKNGEIEIECYTKLNPHKNIVEMLDYKVIDNYVYLALELADCSLIKLIGLWGKDEITLTYKQLNFCIVELLEAYVYISEKNLLHHSDICQPNILYFSKYDRLKISDFGIKQQNDNQQQFEVGFALASIVRRTDHHCSAIPLTLHQRTDCRKCDPYAYDLKQKYKSFEECLPNIGKMQGDIISELLIAKYNIDSMQETIKKLKIDMDILPKPSDFLYM